MLNFGWMWRGAELSISELESLLNEFENAQYDFVLFTVHSHRADFVPKAAFLFDKNQKIKMMFAMRPYLLSPQYAAMIFAGFDQIDPGRVMVNWVNGHNYGSEDKVIGLPQDFADYSVRDVYSEEYFDKLNSVTIDGQLGLPVQVLPASRESAVTLAKKHGMYPILHYEDFIRTYEDIFKQGFKRVFVELCVVPIADELDVELESERILSEIDSHYWRANTFIGHEADIVIELQRLEKLGVTDILIGTLEDEDDPRDRAKVHKIVRQMVGYN